MTEVATSNEETDVKSFKIIEEHPVHQTLDKLNVSFDRLKNSNLSEEEERTLISQINDDRVLLWKSQALFELQNFTGELIKDFDIQKVSAKDLVDDSEKYELVRFFLSRYCFLFNYFYNNYSPHYSQFRDPKLEITEFVHSLLDKAPTLFTREEAENLIFHMIQDQVCKQLEVFHKVFFEYMKLTGELPEETSLEMSLEKFYDHYRKKVEEYEENKKQDKSVWWRKLFAKLTTGD